jgi:hypothetical protein
MHSSKYRQIRAKLRIDTDFETSNHIFVQGWASTTSISMPRMVNVLQRFMLSRQLLTVDPFNYSGAKSKGTALRVHFKHTREILHTIKGMKVTKAKKYLGDVIL